MRRAVTRRRVSCYDSTVNLLARAAGAGLFLLCLAVSTAAAAPAAPPDRLRSQHELEALRLFLQGTLAEERGDHAVAFDAWQRAYLVDPGSPSIARRLAGSLLQAGELPRALEVTQSALQRNPDDAPLHYLRGSLLQARQDYDGARASFERAVALDSLEADYALALARQYERDGRLEEAAGLYRRGLELHGGDDPENEQRLGIVLARLGRFDEALGPLDRAFALEPALPGLIVTRAWVLDELGRGAEAAAGYEQHLRRHPDDDEVRRRLVAVLVGADRARDAVPYAMDVYRRDPTPATGRALAGVYWAAEDKKRASEFALELRRRYPEDLETAEFVIALWSRNGENDRAIAEAKRLTADQPQSWRTPLVLAGALAAAGRDTDSKQALDRAESLAPDSAAIVSALGRAWVEVGESARAESLFQQALAAGADTAATWYDIAGARERAKDFEGAEAAIGLVLARQPDNAQALNFLGYLYADYDRKLDEAVRLLRRALELDPGNGYIMDSMGWAYFRQGKLDSARVELERSLAAGGDDPTILEHLGDVLAAMGEPREARRRYEQALALAPRNGAVQEKLRRVR